MTRILDIFRRNVLKKLIALTAAFIMWVFVMDSQDPAINGSYTVPLTLSNVPYEFLAVCDLKNVLLEVRAPRSKFVMYNADSFRVYANLDGLEEGDHQVSPQVVMPKGFELIEARPSTIQVRLDPMTEQQMPAEVIIKGDVAPDAFIISTKKSMEFATIVGPKSFVEQVNKVYGTVNLSGNASSFETQVTMNAVDEKGNAVPRVRVVPSVITISFNIENGIKKRIVPIVPELSVADGWELSKTSVDPPQIEIVGAESIINSIVTLKTEAFTVQTGQRFFKSTLKLVVPEGVNVPYNEVTVSAEVIRKPVMRDQSSN